MVAPARPVGLEFGVFGSWVDGGGGDKMPARRTAAIEWRTPWTEFVLPGNLRLPEGLGGRLTPRSGVLPCARHRLE